MSIRHRPMDTVIACDGCGKVASWDKMTWWWAGVDRHGNDLHLCHTCQRTAYYCDLCQSIHREDESEPTCSYRWCPGCEELFRGHPGYTGLCNGCLVAGRATAETRTFLTGLSSRFTCA